MSQKPDQPPLAVPPSSSVPPSAQKRPVRKVLLPLLVVASIMLVLCALCALFTTLGIGPLAQAAGPVVVADRYYSAIQRQDYNTAYTFLSPNAKLAVQKQVVPITDQSTFVSAAQALDKQPSPVSAHTIQAKGLDTSHLTAVITRGSKQYEVTLDLVQVGKDWKIVTMSGI